MGDLFSNYTMNNFKTEYEVEVMFKDGQTMKLTLDETFDWCFEEIGNSGYVIFKNTTGNDVPLKNLGGIVNTENMNMMKDLIMID